MKEVMQVISRGQIAEKVADIVDGHACYLGPLAGSVLRAKAEHESILVSVVDREGESFWVRMTLYREDGP